MSISPKIILFSSNLKLDKPSDKQSNHISELKQTLQKYFSNMQIGNLFFGFTPNNETDKECSIHNLCTISIKKGDAGNEQRQIDTAYIYFQGAQNNFKFIIAPFSAASAYDLKLDKDAIERNLALKHMAKILFNISNCEVAITISDEESPPELIENAIHKIKDSSYTLVKSLHVRELAQNLNTIPLFSSLVENEIVELSVTDHPFSLSGYNSFDDIEPFKEGIFALYKTAVAKFC